MRCPACKANRSKVIDSRVTESGGAIRRRRECELCQRRFTTKERIEEELRLTVVKANGSRVPYQRDKVLGGVERACYKLDVTEAEMQAAADRVEEELFRNFDREVSSEQIGAIVGQELRALNPVAYVRFMSVYRKFTTVDEFIEEVSDVQVHVERNSPTQQSLFDT